MKRKNKAKPEELPPVRKDRSWQENAAALNRHFAKKNAQSDMIDFGPLEGPHRFIAHIGGTAGAKSPEDVLHEKMSRDPDVIQAKQDPKFMEWCRLIGITAEQAIWFTKLHQL